MCVAEGLGNRGALGSIHRGLGGGLGRRPCKDFPRTPPNVGGEGVLYGKKAGTGRGLEEFEEEIIVAKDSPNVELIPRISVDSIVW